MIDGSKATQGICPICNEPVPANESNAYGGKHEDCYLKRPQAPRINGESGKTASRGRRFKTEGRA